MEDALLAIRGDPYFLLRAGCPEHKGGTRANCLGNPQCSFGLGESGQRRGVWGPSPACLRELGHSMALREPQLVPAGMVNLGATCYMAAQLQAMFSYLPLRAAVFAWHPHPPSAIVPEGDAGAGSAGVSEQRVTASAAASAKDEMGALQSLFAQLLCTRRAAVNPRTFVTFLGLDAGYQQDATEFNKMLMNFTENIFARSPHLPAPLRTCIPYFFQGERRTFLRCLGCEGCSMRTETFYELDLPLAGRGSVEEALAASLLSETLSGDNAYACDACAKRGKGKQTAVRWGQLTSLPPVLHLQILRFVFDAQLGNKRKLKEAVTIPDIIDLDALAASVGGAIGEGMGGVQQQQGRGTSRPQGNNVYELTGVLYHRGASAHAGHYVADVWDEERAVWWHFDDTEASVVKEGGKDIEAPLAGGGGGEGCRGQGSS